MKPAHALAAVTFCAAMVVSPVTHADDASSPPVAVLVDAAPAGFGSAATPPSSPPVTTPATPSVQEQLEAVIAAFNAYKAQHDTTTKKLLLFALIAAVGNILITVLKKATGMSAEAKKWLPVIALGMGVAVGLFSSLAAGQTVGIAVLYGAGPPLSVFVHELLNLFRKTPPTPPAPAPSA